MMTKKSASVPTHCAARSKSGSGCNGSTGGAIIAHHKRWAALVIDNHGRIAAIAALWDKAVSHVMDAPLKVYRRLWAKPPRIPMVFTIDLIATAVCE